MFGNTFKHEDVGDLKAKMAKLNLSRNNIYHLHNSNLGNLYMLAIKDSHLM